MGRRKGLFGWSSTTKDNHPANNNNHHHQSNNVDSMKKTVTSSPSSTTTVKRNSSEKKSELSTVETTHPIIPTPKNVTSSSSQEETSSTNKEEPPPTHHPPSSSSLSTPHHPSNNDILPSNTPTYEYHYDPSAPPPTFYHTVEVPGKGGVSYMVIPPSHHHQSDQHPEPMFVAPILDISTAAEQLWRIQVPDVRGAIYAIQNLHQAIIHESSSPYPTTGYTLDPAEIFLCIQGAAIRFHSYWEKQKQKGHSSHKKLRRKRNKSNNNNTKNNKSTSKRQPKNDGDNSSATTESGNLTTLQEPTISERAHDVTSSTESKLNTQGPILKSEQPANNNNNNVNKTSSAIDKDDSSHDEDMNKIEAKQSLSQMNHNHNHITVNQPQAYPIQTDPTTSTTNNNIAHQHSSFIKSTTDMDKNKSINKPYHSHNTKHNLNNNNKESSSISASSATSTTNSSQANSRSSDVGEKSVYVKKNRKSWSDEEMIEMEEYFYQIWEESIATIAILSSLMIGPAWRNQIKQRRTWLKEGRVRKGEKRTDDSVSSLGMSSIKRQGHHKQHHLGQKSHTNSNTTSRLNSSSSFPYPNDDPDQAGSSCSGSIGSNPQSAAGNLKHKPKRKHSQNIEALQKGVENWNSPEYNNMAVDEDSQSYPLIPEVLPVAMLRFTAIVSESFFPSLKREDTSIKLPKSYDLIGVEIQREQRWLIRRQRIGAVQREIVLSLCTWDDVDEPTEDQSIRSGKSASRNNNSQPTGTIRYSWSFPRSHGPIASMILFWLDTATTRWPEIHAYLEQEDPDFEDAIEDLCDISAETGEVLWKDIAEVGAIDWWYALQACRAAADLVIAGWKPPPKIFGPQCVLGLLSIAERGMWLFAPHMVDSDEDDIMKFDFDDTQQEAREERLAAASCAAEAMSTLTCLGTRGSIPILSIESIVKGLCSILAIADSANNYELNIDRYPLPDLCAPDISNLDEIKEELELERDSFFSQWNSYLTDTAEFLWVMVAHHTSACSTIATLLNITNIRLSSQESLPDASDPSNSKHNSTILSTGGAIRALGAALWGNPTQVKGIPSLRIYWARFLEVLSKVSASLHEDNSDDNNSTNSTETGSFKAAQTRNSTTSLPSAININQAKSFVPAESESISFSTSKLRDLLEYSSSSLIVFLEVVLALRRLVDGEMIHGRDTLCTDEWELFTKTLSDGLLPWLDHSYTKQVVSDPSNETGTEIRNHVLCQRIHSEVLAIFHQVHSFLTFPINSANKVPLTHHVILDDNCRRRMFILFLREAIPMFPAEQSKSLSISLIKSWTFGGPLFSRHHTWYRTIFDILMETFAVYDDQSHGYPGGYLHPPCIQIVALESVMENYFIHYGRKRIPSTPQTRNSTETGNPGPNSTAPSFEMERLISNVKNNIFSNQIISLLITFQTEALQFCKMTPFNTSRETMGTILPSGFSTTHQSLSQESLLRSESYYDDRLQLNLTAIRILGDLFRRPSTEKRDRLSILNTLHVFAADLSFLKHDSKTNNIEGQQINNALICRLEIISQLGHCLYSSFEENSHVHFTAPMIVDNLSELIHFYSTDCQVEQEQSTEDIACTANVKKLLIYACFIHLASLRRGYDGHAILLSPLTVAKSSLRILNNMINQVARDEKCFFDFRKHLSHVFNKIDDYDSALFSQLIFWQNDIRENFNSTDIAQDQPINKHKIILAGQAGTSLNSSSLALTIQKVLEMSNDSVNLKSELLSNNKNDDSLTNQLILSCHFDISLRMLSNKATDGTMRCGVAYPLDLSLHVPKYSTNPFYDEHRTLDFRIFSEMLATSGYLIDRCLMLKSRPGQSNLLPNDVGSDEYISSDITWEFLMNTLFSDDYVVLSNSCKCLSVLVTCHHSNYQQTSDVSHGEKVAKIVSESLNVLADSLLRKLGQTHEVMKVKNGATSPSSATSHNQTTKDELIPIFSALFDIITHSTSKQNFSCFLRETKSRILNVCFQTLCRKNEGATTWQSRLLALQCARALICIMDAQDIITSMAYVVKLEDDSFESRNASQAAENDSVYLPELIIDMLNRQNARVIEKELKSNRGSLLMNQKMSKEIEDIDAFSVGEHDPTGIAAWLCGNSILMLRKGSPNSRFRGWLEITVRSPTSRARKLIKLSSLLHVQNPEFPSPLWDLLLPQSPQNHSLTSSSVEKDRTKCEEKVIAAAKQQIHRYELIHSCQSLDHDDRIKHSIYAENSDVPSMVRSISNFSSTELQRNSSDNSIPSVRNDVSQDNLTMKRFENIVALTINENRSNQSNDDTSGHRESTNTLLKRSYSAGDIVRQMETSERDDSDVNEKNSSAHCVYKYLKSAIGDSSKDSDKILSYLSLQGLLPVDDKVITSIPSLSVGNNSFQRLKYSFRLRRAIDILDRTTFLQTYKIALLYAGPNIGLSKTESDGLSEVKDENIMLETDNSSPQFLEFCRGLGEHVPTRHLKHFSGGLDTSTYSADGKFAIAWIDENMFSDDHAGHLFSHSMILFHTVPLMPAGINNRKRHVGNDNIHIVYVEDVNYMGPGLSICDIVNDKGNKRDPVISGEFGFATIFVVPLSENTVNITLKSRSKLDKRLSNALKHLVGTTIISKSIAPSFVRQLAMRADLACRSTMQDSLGNFSNWQERLQYINDFERYIET